MAAPCENVSEDVLSPKEVALLEDQLDEECVRCVELLDELVRCRLSLHDAQSEGFLGLAKARYQRGARAVSALQFPQGGPDVDWDDKQAPVRPQVTVTRGQDGVPMLARANGGLTASVKGDEQAGLRKRNEGSSTQPAPQTVDDDAEKPQDPLHWFGVLAPQSLVQSQKCFRTALQLVVQCAHLESQLEAAITKMHCTWQSLESQKEQ